jgi:hypothetical protein
MTALFFAVLYLRHHSTASDIPQQMSGAPSEQVADVLRQLHTATFSGNLAPGIAAIFLKACLLASLTLFISTFATSSTFTIVVTVFVYFIGHLQATAREFWLEEQSAGWIARGFLAIVTLVFPDLHLFDFADEIAAGATVPLATFLNTMALGCFYVVIYLLLAIAVFTGKEL